MLLTEFPPFSVPPKWSCHAWELNCIQSMVRMYVLSPLLQAGLRGTGDAHDVPTCVAGLVQRDGLCELTLSSEQSWHPWPGGCWAGGSLCQRVPSVPQLSKPGVSPATGRRGAGFREAAELTKITELRNRGIQIQILAFPLRGSREGSLGRV